MILFSLKKKTKKCIYSISLSRLLLARSCFSLSWWKNGYSDQWEKNLSLIGKLSGKRRLISILQKKNPSVLFPCFFSPLLMFCQVSYFEIYMDKIRDLLDGEFTARAFFLYLCAEYWGGGRGGICFSLPKQCRVYLIMDGLTWHNEASHLYARASRAVSQLSDTKKGGEKQCDKLGQNHIHWEKKCQLKLSIWSHWM